MKEASPAVIETVRLRLVPIPPEAVRSMLEGDREGGRRALGAPLPADFPGPDDAHPLAVQLERMERAPARRAWLARLIVLAASGEAVGWVAFHGPPEMIGRAELGYTVFARYRGRGYATEATRGMIEWARAEGSPAVFLTISPDNGPSLAVARRLLFRQVGVQEDEVDGTELVFRLDLE
ncbi:MAG: GNAT family N-acetyltransferase [Candidatus Dormibacterales bacterium]